MSPQTLNNISEITEIFSSIQGEGLYKREKHLFIRFKECSMKCSYCDEASKESQQMSLTDVMTRVKDLEENEGPHSFVSLTGGEPLIYASFLKKLIPELKKNNLRVLLETNGTLAEPLKEIIGECDAVSMDVKPPSVTHDKNYISSHREFLRIALQKEVYIKMSISEELEVDDFDRHVDMIAKEAPEIVFFLQPVCSEIPGHKNEKLKRFLEDLCVRGSRRLKNVKVSYRLHKILNIK